jgi:hypothetical protein
MAKVAKLEEKIKEMKINQTGILDNSQNSFFSVESSKKGNLTSHDIDPS